MTTEEFSSGFDTLLNSYAKRIPFGEQVSSADIALDEYEKSFFLTRYQEELVVSMYTGKNPLKDSFESTEEIRRYLSSLVTEAELTPLVNSYNTPLGGDSNSTFYTLPYEEGEEVLFIIYEEAVLSTDTSKNGCRASTETSRSTIAIYPAKHDEYHKLKKNPFRGANSRRAIRFDLSEGNIEIVSKYDISSYYLRYLRKPSPIVLEDFDGITIEGVGEESPCELPEILHQRILEGAVELAIRSKVRTAPQST